MFNLYKWMSVVFLCGSLTTVLASEVNEDPLERTMLDIAQKLRCTVCQNQPVSESNSGLAKDMRDVITEKLKQGQNEAQIMQFFVERYGDYVLLEPPRSGNGVPLWLFPPVLLVLALLVAITMMKGRAKNSAPDVPMLTDDDRERIRRARDEDKAGDE